MYDQRRPRLQQRGEPVPALRFKTLRYNTHFASADALLVDSSMETLHFCISLHISGI